MAFGLSSNRLRSTRSLGDESGLPGLARGANRIYSSVRSLAGGPFGGNALRATLTTALAGTNNDLTFRSIARGSVGNLVTVAYVVSGTSTPLTVAVSGSAITVNVATNGGGTATSTAAQVEAAVEASATAGRLVDVVNADGNDGTGVVTALTATPLTGGTNLITYGRMVLATLTTSLTGTNNDVVLTAKPPTYSGKAGNAISLTITVSGVSTAQSISVSGTDITFVSATNGSSAATSTAANLKTAIDSTPAAAALVTVANAPGNDGTGTVAALAKTNLTGGLDYATGP